MTFNMRPNTDRTPDQQIYPLRMKIEPDALRVCYIQHSDAEGLLDNTFETFLFIPWKDIRILFLEGDRLLIESDPVIRERSLLTRNTVDYHWPFYGEPKWLWHKLQLPIPKEQLNEIVSALRQYHPVITDPEGYIPFENPRSQFDPLPLRYDLIAGWGFLSPDIRAALSQAHT